MIGWRGERRMVKDEEEEDKGWTNSFFWAAR